MMDILNDSIIEHVWIAANSAAIRIVQTCDNDCCNGSDNLPFQSASLGPSFPAEKGAFLQESPDLHINLRYF